LDDKSIDVDNLKDYETERKECQNDL
jgi:hypothetical protein